MEVYESRGALRRLMRAHLGMATDDVLASQNTEQFDALLDSAYLEAFADCRWLKPTTQTTFNVGIAQYKVPYPAGTTPGSIMSAAIYDIETNEYVRISKRIIPVELSVDQSEILGGDDYARIQGKPHRYEPRGDFIYLDPPPDKPYRIRIEYQTVRKFVDDTTVSTVDGLLILYNALAAERIRDPQEASVWNSKYVKRLSMLRGWQSTGEKFAMDSTASFDEMEELQSGLHGLPNYDRSPTVR